MLTQERLKELLSYDPESGIFRWTTENKNGLQFQPAGFVNSYGYVHIWISGKRHLAHRLAWLYVFGEFPVGVIDHINRNKADNRLCNLREVSQRENLENVVKARRNNKSGLLGAYFDTCKGRWVARITVKGRKVRLGYFGSAEDAHSAYMAAKRKLHEGYVHQQ